MIKLNDERKLVLMMTVLPTDPRYWMIATSCGLFDPLTIREMNACRQAGLNALEIILFGGWISHYTGDLRSICREVHGDMQAAGLTAWSIHLPFGWEWDLSDPNPGQRQAILARCQKLLDEAAVLEPTKAVIHPSYEPLPPEERPARLAACQDALQILSRTAADLGMQLAVECLPRTCLGNTSIEILQLIDGIPEIGVCCDVNHLFQETPQNFITQIGSRLATVHISDYDGIDERHWLPGRGINDWPAVIRALAAVGYAGPWMFEVSAATALQPLTPQVLADCWRDLLRDFTGSKT